MSIFDKLDQTEASAEFTMLPEGEYQATVTNIEIKEEFDDVKINVEYTMKSPMPGRKAWFNTQLGPDASAAKLGFVKGQICKIAGVESTNGNVQGTLAGSLGNDVVVEIKHNVSAKNGKTYANVYCLGKSNAEPSEIPF